LRAAIDCSGESLTSTRLLDDYFSDQPAHLVLNDAKVSDLAVQDDVLDYRPSPMVGGIGRFGSMLLDVDEKTIIPVGFRLKKFEDVDHRALPSLFCGNGLGK